MLLALLGLLAAATPDGTRLAEGDACYVIEMVRGEVVQPLGLTRQTVRRVADPAGEQLEISVHQSVPARSFDMKDVFRVRRGDLSPVSLRNYRNGALHVSLDYAPGRVRGSRHEGGREVQIDQPLSEKVVEGNLWGLTFAALPLAPGASFDLPFYQYDKGLGRFTAKVKGERTVDTPAGPVSAWIVDGGIAPGSISEYWLAKDGRELGYAAGPMRQRLGGDCSALK